MNSAATVMNSVWIVIFVPCTVNPCDVTVHAQEGKKNLKTQTKKRQTSTPNAHDVIHFDEGSNKQMKTTPDYFAKKNDEVKETAAFCLMKTRNQHVWSCKPKSVIKKDSCQFPIRQVLKYC